MALLDIPEWILEVISHKYPFQKKFLLYTITKVTCQKNKVYITYSDIPNHPIEELQGSVYFTGGIVGIFSKGDNHYWNNKIIIECNSEDEAKNIKIKNQFTLLNQWEKKIENKDLIKSLEDPFYYYNLVHSIIEDNKSSWPKKSIHNWADKELNIKDYD